MAQHVDVVSVGSLSSDELFENWRYAISQGNIPRGRAIDPVTKWLLIVRACVFPMTLTSGLIGGLLAVATASTIDWSFSRCFFETNGPIWVDSSCGSPSRISPARRTSSATTPS